MLPLQSDNPPQDISKFLEWLRVRTEDAWSKLADPTIADFELRRVGGSAWQQGTRWLSGLSDPQIDVIESQWGLRFPHDYRLFLRMLHAPDRPMFTAGFHDGNKLISGFGPSFYNWLTDIDAIRNILEWPLEALSFDVVHNNLWFDDWGPRPNDEVEVRRRLEELIAFAPRLIPDLIHRYIVNSDSLQRYFVLSVYQSDIMVYATNLRSYLLSELGGLIGIHDIIMGSDVTEEDYRAAQSIPFWGKFL